MTGFGKKGNSKTKKASNKKTKLSKEEIINKAFKFQSQGNIPEAAKDYQYFITQGFKHPRVFLNYGIILKNLGKLQEAEISLRKAIKIKPYYAKAYYNLGNILIDLWKLQEAEVSLRKAIDIKPDYAEAYYNLGNILRILGKLEEAKLCSEKIISKRSWSILGSYSFNREMKLD